MVQAFVLLSSTPMALLVLQELTQLGGDTYALLFKVHRQTCGTVELQLQESYAQPILILKV